MPRGGTCGGLQATPGFFPVQDMLVNRGDQALFSCIVAFQLPESEVTYSWKYAGGGVSPETASWRAWEG